AGASAACALSPRAICCATVNGVWAGKRAGATQTSHARTPRIAGSGQRGAGNVGRAAHRAQARRRGAHAGGVVGAGCRLYGGTLAQLEPIPGFRTGFSLVEAKAQSVKIGCVMIGQTAEIAPADRRLYALRDVTGTVEAIPIIAASIMSKKLAEGLNALVLDVKRGSGAFLPALEQALGLAQTMIAL